MGADTLGMTARLLGAMANAGARRYGGERVSELAHALQCADLARGGGAIVNSASTLAFVALEGRSIYSASKAGVVGMSRAAAVEYAARNVRVNVICPGTTETALFAGLLKEYADQPEKIEAIRSQQPINRWAQPSELAEAALFLFSEGASYVIGAALIVDGGYTLR